ncbi:hypothetical protein GGF41_006045, partial [Coemansia sp. RSA 2531]
MSAALKSLFKQPLLAARLAARTSRALPSAVRHNSSAVGDTITVREALNQAMDEEMERDES